MSATAAPTARPATGAIAWATKTELFVEYPTKGGTPYVTRFPLTSTGLAQALSILIENAEHGTHRLTASDHPSVKRQPLTTFTPDQRSKARDVLRRLKIV